ncbi:hypothetical protein K6V92_07410 [Cupriavidus respiraculi]|uniref:hypothetical protein n=1 Tax=Cupriavidus respiraculi TaxID=195930 RepID=UPI001C95F36B|nr:hypothetical protein [Cupriavidus respiraculi]MBY4946450.1 hypothetical protein [Cupriavidus respiraculi]
MPSDTASTLSSSHRLDTGTPPPVPPENGGAESQLLRPMFVGHCLDVVQGHLGLRATSALSRTCWMLHHRLDIAVAARRMELELEALEIADRAGNAASPPAVAAVLAETARNPFADRDAIAGALMRQAKTMRAGKNEAQRLLRIAIEKESDLRACRLRYGVCLRLFTNEQLATMRQRDVARLPTLPPEARGELLAIIVRSHDKEHGFDAAAMKRYVDIAATLPPAWCSTVARALVDSHSAFSYFRAGPPALTLYGALIGIAIQMREPDGNLDAHGRAIFESLVKPLECHIAPDVKERLPAGSFSGVFNWVCNAMGSIAPAQRGPLLRSLATGLGFGFCADTAQGRMQGWSWLYDAAASLSPEVRAEYFAGLLRWFESAPPAEIATYRSWWLNGVATLPAPQMAAFLASFCTSHTDTPWDTATRDTFMTLMDALPPRQRSEVLRAYISARGSPDALPEIHAGLGSLPPEERERPLGAALYLLMSNHNWRRPYDPLAATSAPASAKRRKGDDALTWILGHLEALPVSSRAAVLLDYVGHWFSSVDRAWRAIMQLVQGLPAPERESGISEMVRATLHPHSRHKLSHTNWCACMKAVLTIPATSPRRACALKALEDSIHLLPAAERAACEKQLADAAAPAPPPAESSPDS